MAARASWKGVIALGPGGMIPVSVEAFKARDEYKGNDPLRNVCACHHQPIDARHRCAVSGELGPARAKAVEDANGNVIVLSDAQVESIKAGLDKSTIEPLSYEPRERVTLDMLAGDLWQLTPNRKDPTAKTQVEALREALASSGKVLRARVVSAGRQHVVLIYDLNGKLMASRAIYAQERKPLLELEHVAVPAGAGAMLDNLLDTELPDTFDMGTVEDVTVARKVAVVQHALAGGGEAVGTTEVAPSSPVPDLMARLSEAIAQQGTPKKPARKTTTKAKEATKA